MLSGPAGTGKSVACLFKLHYLCSKVPGVRALIVRKTRESLTESALVTLEQKVMEPRCKALTNLQRRTRQNYTYPNGSQIIVGGMDKPSKIMSTEYDLIYVQEAIELNEEDWEALITRLRNGRLPYQQILADTNPDTPQHWIRQRAASGRLALVESHHEDNPYLFDASRRVWTLKGLEYLETLERLTGPRYQRLRHGKWVQAEGAVYDEFNRATHVVDFGYPPMDWERYVAIDFGYTNPFVCLWGATDPDGRLWIYKQMVRTQALVEDLAKVILGEFAEEKRHIRRAIGMERNKKKSELGEQEAALWFLNSLESVDAKVRPRAIICDHDAEDRATLQRHLNMQTTPAHKLISPGIQAVQSRLRVQPDGRPRLLIGRNSLMGRDPKMEAGKLPIGLAEEMEGYVWDVGNGRKRGEEPLKLNDHAVDSLRYLVAYLDVQIKKKVEVW